LIYINSLESFLRTSQASTLPKGAIAVIFVEDDVGIAATIRHHARIGFKNIFLLEATEFDLPPDCAEICIRISCDRAVPDAMNMLISAFPERWIYYCHNAEFLHFPFYENRSVEELITFIQDERRQSCLAYIIDLYGDDLEADPIGYSLETAHLDEAGYYAMPRQIEGELQERQLNIYGGLKWRFEEHFPPAKRRIDRTVLFKAEKGLKMGADFLFNNPEYNTYQCPWHNSTTAAVCSFRTAKYLKANPGSTFEIHSFLWDKSTKFHWSSQQLMDLGLMEPGQWF